jgi:hypothetical protein
LREANTLWMRYYKADNAYAAGNYKKISRQKIAGFIFNSTYVENSKLITIPIRTTKQFHNSVYVGTKGG